MPFWSDTEEERDLGRKPGETSEDCRTRVIKEHDPATDSRRDLVEEMNACADPPQVEQPIGDGGGVVEETGDGGEAGASESE